MLRNAPSPSKNFNHCTIRFISVMDAFVQSMPCLAYLDLAKRKLFSFSGTVELFKKKYLELSLFWTVASIKVNSPHAFWIPSYLRSTMSDYLI